jgi:hypothetical protein
VPLLVALLCLVACHHRAPEAAAGGQAPPAPVPDGARLQAAPADWPAVAWDPVFDTELRSGTRLWQVGGRAWGLAPTDGLSEELFALGDDGSVRWRRTVHADDFVRITGDGQSLLIADFLGCFGWFDPDTGEQVDAHSFVLDPWHWDVTADGRDVWTWDDGGRLLGRRRGVDDPVARIGVPADEVGADLQIAGDVLYLETEQALVARSLPDGRVLGRFPWREGEICDATADRIRVWPDPEAEAPVPLAPGTLRRLGPADPEACRGPLDFGYYGLMLRESGWWSPFGYGHDDALRRPDGTVWLLDGARWSGWRPTERSIRAAPLSEGERLGAADAWINGDQLIYEAGGQEVTALLPSPAEDAWSTAETLVTVSEGAIRVYALPGLALVDQVLVTPPQRTEAAVRLYEVARQPDGALWVAAAIDEQPWWLEIGPPGR